MGTLLDDLRWVREASTALRRMPDPFHHPEPWMNLLGNENEWSKALRQLDVKCSRPRKSEGARYMSDDQLLENPQAFVCMLCTRDKRRCCNSAGALVSHQHRSHGYKNPFRRATVDDSCLACGKTFGTRAKALDHIAYRAKRCRQAFLNGSISWASEEETAVAFSLGAWFIVGTAACVSSTWQMSLSQGQTFAACVGSRLVAWSSGACATTIQIPFLVLSSSTVYSTTRQHYVWFFHYIRCYSLCDVAINDMVCTSALSVSVARHARRRDGLGTNEYLCSPSELTELSLSTTTWLFATRERH